MSFFRKKKHSPSNSAPANRLASQSQARQQPQIPTESQSQSQSRQQPLPWSAHTPPSGQRPSPFDRRLHAMSTGATATGELFLFGGYVYSSNSPSNDLYVISARDFSTTLLSTSGDIPSPRFSHQAVLTSTALLIWGGTTDSSDRNDDDYLYLLNLGTSDLFHVKTRSS